MQAITGDLVVNKYLSSRDAAVAARPLPHPERRQLLPHRRGLPPRRSRRSVLDRRPGALADEQLPGAAAGWPSCAARDRSTRPGSPRWKPTSSTRCSSTPSTRRRPQRRPPVRPHPARVFRDTILGVHRREAVKLCWPPGATGCARAASKRLTMTETTPQAMPAIFLAHGSPFLLDDGKWVGELAAWARALPRPRAILMLSAHWVDRPITIGATRRVPLVYDFYGFPAKYYQITYDAPPAPELATRLRGLLARRAGRRGARARARPRRLRAARLHVPGGRRAGAAGVAADARSDELFALGRTLAPLRREGILIVGSGFLTHNLRTMDFRPDAPVPTWAAEFDAWTADVLARRDVDALLDYRQRAPGRPPGAPHARALRAGGDRARRRHRRPDRDSPASRSPASPTGRRPGGQLQLG